MVRGLAKFADHFAMYTNQYIIIGATPSDIIERLYLVFSL